MKMRKLSAREQMAYRTIATLELERDAALGREAALREELDSRPGVSIKNCILEGKNADGSQAFEFETLEGGLNKLTKINLDGWLCYGPSGESHVTVLQQRLTVAEQREAELIGLLKLSLLAVDDVADNCEDQTDWATANSMHALSKRITSALKPAEGEGS